MSKFDSPTVIGISMVALAIATLSTNIAANVVSPANDFSNLAPRRISFKLGGLITAGVGIAIFPWKLYADPEGYIFVWLIGYSALLGPIGGILIADYFLIRRCRLNVEDLYRRGGIYEYSRGFNLRALLALVMGIAPSLPGFLQAVGLVARHTFIDELVSLYNYAWFVGFAVAFTSYVGLMWIGPRPAR
jgi:NCS1 family nucleobase:cation symporter-1